MPHRFIINELFRDVDLTAVRRIMRVKREIAHPFDFVIVRAVGSDFRAAFKRRKGDKKNEDKEDYVTVNCWSYDAYPLGVRVGRTGTC
jgi:hypothetical protein